MFRTMKNLTSFCAVAALLLLGSCSESEDAGGGGSYTPTPKIVKGKAEKGPMVQGSKIEMRTLNADMTPTGSSYSASIENNSGDFNYGTLTIDSPYAMLTAEGYFFNEVRGELSSGMIKLDAIVDLSDKSTINVNVITHLKSGRIQHLVNKEEKTFAEANKQAQRELLTQFGLQKYSDKDASQYGITTGDDTSGVLIAISSYILCDRTEAEIVEFLSNLTNEFANSGKFSDKTKTKLRTTLGELNYRLETIADNIRYRYEELGQEVNVLPLDGYFDWDNDGVAGNEVGENDEVVLSPAELNVPKEGGKYTVSIDAASAVYLTPPSFGDGDGDTPSGGVSSDQFFSGLYKGEYSAPQMSYSKTLENNVLTLEFSAAQFRKEKTATIPLYDCRGNQVAGLTIVQQGDPDIKSQILPLGNGGENIVYAMMSYMRDFYRAKLLYEGRYAQTLSPYNPVGDEMSSLWNNAYRAVNMIMRIKEADANALGCYQEFLDTYLALMYFTMSTHWGGVPYYESTEQMEQAVTLPRTEEKELLTLIASKLEEAVPVLEEKRNDAFSEANSMLFVSKDVARVVLAYVYCNLSEYAKAKSLLETVVSNDYYDVAEHTLQYLDDEECILGFVHDTRTGIVDDHQSIIPCLDYKEVLLTLAECCHYAGDEDKAREYVDYVCAKKGFDIKETDILMTISNIRYRLQSPNYLVFFRRNSLGIKGLGLSEAQLHELLWPVPQRELDMNPYMTQNSGY